MTALLPSKTFWIVLRLFSFKFCHILSTVGFINDDSYCHSQRIGQLSIKEKPLKGIFKVDHLINVAANTQISPSLLLTSAICKQTINFFLHECFLEFFFFPEIMLECWGCGLYTSAAYTRVFTVITKCHWHQVPSKSTQRHRYEDINLLPLVLRYQYTPNDNLA